MSKKLTAVDVYNRVGVLLAEVRSTVTTPKQTRQRFAAIAKRAANLGILLSVPTLEEFEAMVPTPAVEAVVQADGFSSSEETYEEDYETSYESSEWN
jgi:hypothetical protein